MLGAMRTLALDYLYEKLGDRNCVPGDLEAWYRELRADSPESLFPYLVEGTENAEKVYVIHHSAGSGLAQLSVRDMTGEIASGLPFVKPPGARDAQVGPVIKRSFDKAKGAGPSANTLRSTMSSFASIAGSNQPWSSYFGEIVSILSRERIKLTDGSVLDWKPRGYQTLLEAVVQEIGPQKGSVLITVQDEKGCFPGQRKEYINYLMSEKLAGDRYVTGEARQYERGVCPLCREPETTVFPNALRGAGINFRNADREGAFPGLDMGAAWKGFALCAPCADLLYIYKNHFLKKIGSKKDNIPFTARIAGERALVIPFSTVNAEKRRKLLNRVTRFVRSTEDDVGPDEAGLLDLLKDEKAVLNLTFLWADMGQYIDNVRGILTDVPPSRLSDLSEFNESAKTWRHGVFPEVRAAEGKFDFNPDLSLKALYSMFQRPGGKKSQSVNESRRLFQVKRAVAASVYHKRPIPTGRFRDELMTTARHYWLQAIDEGDAYKLLNEGRGKNGPFLTAAGWIRNVAWWLYYFQRLEVMEMKEQFFQPQMEGLKPYFGPESGIDSSEKAYTFLLGVLYGRLLEVQGARGINVGSNALTWLRRLTLKGKDLPGLYVKIREKLLVYEAEKSEKLRDLITEIGNLGIRLGDPIQLDETQTNYYLLLGQSLAKTILKKEDK